MKPKPRLRRVRLATLAGLCACASFSLEAAAFDWRASERAQQEVTSLLQQAFAAHESGNSTAALALLDQADRLRPNLADSANLRGTVYLRQGDFAKASAAFARAVACDPNLWAARFNLAEVAFRQKDFARARASFDALVNQTNRFKENARWELAQYKSFLCCLLLHDDTGAQKRLARLPAGATALTPARLCAEAALAFVRKDPAAANRLVAEAQAGKYKNAALFFHSLEQAGWLRSLPTPMTPLLPDGVGALANVGRGNNGSGGSASPGFVPMQNVPIPEPELPVADGGVPPPAPPTVNRLPVVPPPAPSTEKPSAVNNSDATVPIP